MCIRDSLSALRQYKLSLIVVMVFAILSTIFNIAGPKILALSLIHIFAPDGHDALILRVPAELDAAQGGVALRQY